MKFGLARLSVALTLVAPSVWAQQQATPLTDEMLEQKEEAPLTRAEKKKREQGAEFKDNPEWLEKELKAEADAKAAQAEAEGKTKRESSYLAGYRKRAGLGLSPLSPQGPSILPGGVTPSMGSPLGDSDFTFEFHGYLQAGLRAGIGSRDEAFEGQQKTTVHGDPVVAGASFGWFDHTNTVPVPWTQLNFTIGNDVVRATAVIGAWSPTQADEAQGYFQPPSKLGFNDAYLTYTPDIGAAKLRINAGVYQEHYGPMSRYHNGAYGVSLIGSVYGMGSTGTLTLPYDNDVTVTIEAGVKGDFNRAPPEIPLDQSNEFVPAIEGSTYAAHGHLAFDFDTWVELTGHGIYTFSQDDRSDDLAGRELYLEDGDLNDGSLLILGADARFRLKQWGHLYVGGSQIIGEDTQTLTNLVQVLNNGPGRDLTQRYFTYASGGNGKMTLVGGQYELSLGRLLRYPTEFSGGAPDLSMSIFGIYGSQENDGDFLPDTDMLKFGSEWVYSPLRHLALSVRGDAVMPNLAEGAQSFGVITPKVVFRNDWNNQATLTLQYSGYLLGKDTFVRGDDRLINQPSEQPDAHLAAVYGTIWW